MIANRHSRNDLDTTTWTIAGPLAMTAGHRPSLEEAITDLPLTTNHCDLGAEVEATTTQRRAGDLYRVSDLRLVVLLRRGTPVRTVLVDLLWSLEATIETQERPPRLLRRTMIAMMALGSIQG